VIEHKGYTEACDWWSLGVLVYSLLVGKTPFASPGDNELVVYKNITAGTYNIPQEVSGEASNLIQSLVSAVFSDGK
jgi:serine/threonine protein kinase